MMRRMPAAVIWMLLSAAPLAAQCAMCREAAASQQEQAVAALNAGILVLGAPPLLALGGMVWLLRRYSSRV